MASDLEKPRSHEREKAGVHRADQQESKAHVSTHPSLLNLCNNLLFFGGDL